MGTVKKILKLDKEERKYPDVHPFTVVKKKRNKTRSFLFFLIILTVLVYSYIFYMEFIKSKKNVVKNELDTRMLKSQVEKEVLNSVKSIKIPQKKHKKETIDDIFKKAVKSYSSGNYNEALYYVRLILDKKEFIPAVILKAKILKKEGFRDRARAILEEAYYRYPENKDILLELASIYEEEGALIIAKDMYKTLSENGYIEGEIGLARIYEKSGEREKALSIYRKLYENPNLPEKIRKKVEKKIILLEK